MGQIRQILKKKKILFVFKGYTCRFKSEAFASFASIVLRPCTLVKEVSNSSLHDSVASCLNCYKGTVWNTHMAWIPTKQQIAYKWALLCAIRPFVKLYAYITNLVCYTYFHWFFNPECQHIFGKQTGYIFQSPKTIKTWTTKHYASLNQWYNTE
jgi:hypothetical protein